MLEFEGYHIKVIMSGRLIQTGPAIDNDELFTGIGAELEFCQNGLQEGLGWVEGTGNTTKIFIRDMMPGSFIVVHRIPDDNFRSSLEILESEKLWDSFEILTGKLSLSDLNIILYRCEQEEKDSLRTHTISSS